MHRLLTGAGVLAVLVGAGPAWAGGWTVVHQETDGAVTNLVAHDAKNAFAFALQKPPGSDNPSPVWMRTQDGAQWAISPAEGHVPGAIVMMSDLVCPTSQKCFAFANSIDAGTMGIKYAFITSKDGGKTWTWPVAEPFKVIMPARMAALSETEIWGLGGGLKVAHTTTGGAAWEFVTPKVGATWYQASLDASFIDGARGWMTNGKSTVDDKKVETIAPVGGLLRTEDGGKTWTVLYEGKTEVPERIRMVNASVGWLWGHDASGIFLRRTDDGGVTWSPVTLPTPAAVAAPTSIDAVHAFNENGAFVLASGAIGDNASYHVVYKVSDGHTLVEESTGVQGQSNALITMACASQRLCWAGGANMMLLKYEGDADIAPGADSGPTGTDAAGGSDTGTAGSDAAGGADTAPAACVGGYVCDGNRRMTCDADGAPKAFVENCATTGKACEAGACVAGPASSSSGGCAAGSSGAWGWAAVLGCLAAAIAFRRRAM